MEIQVRRGDVDGALKVLKRQLAKEGVFKELKRREAYSKPSVRRKQKRQDAARGRRKLAKLLTKIGERK